MNRQNLIDAIVEDTEAFKAATIRSLDSLITIIQNEMAKGGTVKFTGFGTFGKTAVAVRTGYSPKAGVPIKIPSTHKSELTLGATFKDLVKD